MLSVDGLEALKTYIDELDESQLANLSNEVSDEFIQKILTIAVKLYSARLEDLEAPEFRRLAPFSEEFKVNPTEVLRTVIEMLKASDIALFELGMWQAWGK